MLPVSVAGRIDGVNDRATVYCRSGDLLQVESVAAYPLDVITLFTAMKSSF